MIMSPTLRHGGGCLCLPPLIPARYPSHALQQEAPLQDNYKEFSVCFHIFKKMKKQGEKNKRSNVRECHMEKYIANRKQFIKKKSFVLFFFWQKNQ